MLGLGKVNMAGPLIFLSVIFLLTRRPLRSFVIAATLGGIALDMAILSANQVSVVDLLRNYLDSSSGRMSPAMWYFCLANPLSVQGIAVLASAGLLALATGVIVLSAKWTDRHEQTTMIALFVIALLVMACGMMTNNDTKTLDLACLVVLLVFIHPRLLGSDLSPIRVSYGLCGLLLNFY